MVNELRTWLLNRDGQDNPGQDYPGEEYAPPAFRPGTPAPDLLATYQLLFGSSPDRASVNWRLRSYFRILHATPLVDFVTSLDRRITYLPFRTDLFDRVAAGPVATPITINTGQTVQLNAAGPAIESAGRIKFQWRLDVVDASTVLVRSYTNDTFTSATMSYTIVSGISTPIVLPGSFVTAQFTPGTGAAWIIDLLAQPSRSLTNIVTDLESALSPSRLNSLFGADPAEPYKTFRNLWETHDQLPYRLGGVVLATGYQLRG